MLRIVEAAVSWVVRLGHGASLTEKKTDIVEMTVGDCACIIDSTARGNLSGGLPFSSVSPFDLPASCVSELRCTSTSWSTVGGPRRSRSSWTRFNSAPPRSARRWQRKTSKSAEHTRRLVIYQLRSAYTYMHMRTHTHISGKSAVVWFSKKPPPNCSTQRVCVCVCAYCTQGREQGVC